MTQPAQTDEALAEAIARARRAYDEVPYTSIPFPRLQPSRLAANLTQVGLVAPDCKHARALEIGCAAGGHIMPLAAIFPEAEFVGVDISTAQIADGEARRQRLGLSNISLRARSLDEIDASWGQFDYIVCHGVYSWVPDAIRDAIMRVCAERLSENGVAVISFNVLPGWRMFQAMRDGMILHAGGEPDPAVRAARTRQLLDAMGALAPSNTTYGAIWRSEAAHIASQPDFYIAHEFFSENNEPCTFLDFVNKAERHGLRYLCESSPRENLPEAENADRAAFIRAQAGGDEIAKEQYFDIVSGRTFREAMLVRNGRRPITSALLEPSLIGLHLVAALHFAVKADEPDRLVLEGEANPEITLTQPFAISVMREVLRRRPASTPVAGLIAREGDPARRQALCVELIQLQLRGLLDFSSEPTTCAISAGARPKVWSLVASDAAAGRPASSSLRHAAINLTPRQMFVAQRLDGSRAPEAIAEELVALAISGALRIADDKGPVTDPERLRAICLKGVKTEIDELLRVGALVDP